MRGRVPFNAEGKEYALRFTTNRLCQLEEDTGITVMQFVQKMDKPENINFLNVRMLMQAGLEGNFTLEQAGDVADELGVNAALALIARAFAAAFEAGKAAPAGPAGSRGKTKAAAA